MQMVAEIMKSPVIMARPDQTAADVVALMRQHNIGHLPVVEGEGLVGIVSDRNVREATVDPRVFTLLLDFIASMDRARVRDIMTPDVITTTPETPMSEAARLMVSRRIGCLPVVKDGRLVGIVVAADLLRTLSAHA